MRRTIVFCPLLPRIHRLLFSGVTLMESQDLRKAGLKATAPRLKMLEFLEKAQDRHLTAEAIYRQLLEAGEEIGLATVYRALAQFEAGGPATPRPSQGRAGVFCLCGCA